LFSLENYTLWSNYKIFLAARLVTQLALDPYINVVSTHNPVLAVI